MKVCVRCCDKEFPDEVGMCDGCNGTDFIRPVRPLVRFNHVGRGRFHAMPVDEAEDRINQRGEEK